MSEDNSIVAENAKQEELETSNLDRLSEIEKSINSDDIAKQLGESPIVEPVQKEETKETQEPEEAKETEDKPKDAVADEEEANNVKKKLSGFQRVKAKQSHIIAEQAKTLAEQAAIIARLQGPVEQGPQRQNFNSDDDYFAANAQYHWDKVAKTKEVEAIEVEMNKKYSDYAEVKRAGQFINVSKELGNVLGTLDNKTAAEVKYYLAKNPSETVKLNLLTGNALVERILDLDTESHIEDSPIPPKVTNAPSIPAKVRSSAAVSEDDLVQREIELVARQMRERY